jgi:hypothetical protein
MIIAIRRKLFFGLVGLLLLLTGCSDPFEGQPHLSDSQLIAAFQTHKPDFERLRTMILEDKGLTRVDDDWTVPTDPQTIGITVQRIAEYRKLFQKLGIARGFSAYEDRHEIEFWASAQGWVAHGSHKGYVYASAIPAPILESLDSLAAQKGNVGYGYKHIEDNWYLSYYGD